jgi:hypothetical protein
MRGILCLQGISREAEVKKTGILIAALAGVLAGTQAQAQSTSTYLGISGAAVWKDARFGVEFGYYILGKYDIENAGGAVQDQLKASALAVSGVYSTPIGYGYSFNGKLGIAFTEAKYDCKLACGGTFLDTRRRGTSGLIGVGVGWQAASNLAFRIDYEHIGGLQHAVSTIRFKEGYDLMSVGVQLQF